ncbi:flagellar type III secretion system pore protein FliP [Temperatibacter marinus]|uniref:Flagellar biosynthetic protein FliP n=1 Tax=Temperatibacter marinus TaxID=1456591 RepID=A0AA52EG09_9PROT|nr:flagellar type III secretion system pore protein FliP [Temperatibacter marinus]WND02140.1 flagellar type III secretion system pore protein FliP [Temperatibacter marinus]
MIRTLFAHKYFKKSLIIVSALAFPIVMLMAAPVAAQELTLSMGDGETVSGRVVQLLMLMTVLSLAPSILIMMTSFTRFVIVFSLLRSAMGVQQTPPNMVMVSLALFLTFFVMQPTFDEAWETAINPMINEQIEEDEAYNRIQVPFKKFMLAQVRDKDIILFLDLRGQESPENAMDIDITTLVPAFMISEVRRAFEIGFLLYIPFIVIDMVVASILMSMGMMMLPPIMIALPFKIIFFVLVDGWNMLVGTLVRSFGAPIIPGSG